VPVVVAPALVAAVSATVFVVSAKTVVAWPKRPVIAEAAAASAATPTTLIRFRNSRRGGPAG
jgi:hypothetical protein